MAAPRVDAFAINLPLWAHGLEEPQGWLFAPRTTAANAVVFASAGGALALTVVDVRNALFPLFDAVWLYTGIDASVNILVQERRLRVVFTERIALPAPTGDFTAIASFAPASLDGGVELRIRGPRDREDQLLHGSLAHVQRGLLDTLAARGFSRAPEPSGAAIVCRRPREIPPIQYSAYVNVCERLVQMVAANPKNAFMEPLKPAVQRETVAIAREIATASPDSEAAQLTWLAASIYAHRAENLKRGDKKLAIAAVRERTDIDDPVHRLAPAILALFGEEAAAKTEARAALASLGTAPSQLDPYRGRSDPAAAYRAWLQRVLDRP